MVWQDGVTWAGAETLLFGLLTSLMSEPMRVTRIGVLWGKIAAVERLTPVLVQNEPMTLVNVIMLINPGLEYNTANSDDNFRIDLPSFYGPPTGKSLSGAAVLKLREPRGSDKFVFKSS